MTGRPMRSAAATASAALVSTPVPGSTGTPAFSMVWRARTLSPITCMWMGSGPMKVIPHFWTISANSARSARKP